MTKTTRHNEISRKFRSRRCPEEKRQEEEESSKRLMITKPSVYTRNPFNALYESSLPTDVARRNHEEDRTVRCHRPRRLKNPFLRNSRKWNCVRMRYKRFSGRVDIFRLRFIDRFCSLHVLADGFSRTGSDCAASAPIMRHNIYDIALDAYDLAGGCRCPQASHRLFARGGRDPLRKEIAMPTDSGWA